MILRLFTLSTLLPLLLLSPSHAMISIDVRSKMEATYDFATQSVIQRMINTQQPKIEEGLLTPFEAKCIAINTVDLLTLERADRFIRITEQAFAGQAPSLQDERFIRELSEQYLPYMQLIANQCAKEERAEMDKKEAAEAINGEEQFTIPEGFTIISPHSANHKNAETPTKAPSATQQSDRNN